MSAIVSQNKPSTIQQFVREVWPTHLKRQARFPYNDYYENPARKFLNGTVGFVFLGAATYGLWEAAGTEFANAEQQHKTLYARAQDLGERIFEMDYRPAILQMSEEHLQALYRQGNNETQSLKPCIESQKKQAQVLPTIKNGRVVTAARDEALDMPKLKDCFAAENAKKIEPIASYGWFLTLGIGMFGCCAMGLRSAYRAAAGAVNGGAKPFWNLARYGVQVASTEVYNTMKRSPS